MQVLLDEQNTDAGLSNDPAHRGLNVLHDVGLNPFGGLVQEQELGLPQQGTGNRQLLLLTAAQVPALAG